MYASLALRCSEKHDSTEVGGRKAFIGAVLHEEEFCYMALAERVRVFDLCSTDFVEVIEDKHGRAMPSCQYKKVAEECAESFSRLGCKWGKVDIMYG